MSRLVSLGAFGRAILKHTSLHPTRLWGDEGPHRPSRNTAPMQLHGIEGHTMLFTDGRRLGQVASIE